MEEEIEQLRSLLDSPSSQPIEKIIPPKGVSPKDIKAVRDDMVDNSIYSYEELVEKIISMPVLPKITSGMDNIDELLHDKFLDGTESVDGGYVPGDLIVLLGFPKSGKTQFLITLTYNQSLSGVPSLWFTLEMQWHEIVKSFILMDNDYKTEKKIISRPIYMPTDTRGMTIAKMRSQIEEAKEKYGVKMIYIDHLQRLYKSDEMKKSNSPIYVGELVRELKDIAKELQVTIMLISHITKGDQSIMPTSSSARDSSLIVAEADFVFVMWRERLIKDKKSAYQENEEVYTDRTFFSVDENRRNGKTKRMLFALNNNRFVKWEDYVESQWDKYSDNNGNIKNEEEIRVDEVAGIFGGEII